MKTQLSKIRLYADEISAKEFESFLSAQFAKDVKLETTLLKKEGRGANEIMDLVFSDDMAINLMASFIFQFIMYGLGRLNRSVGAEPVATIELDQKVRIKLPLKDGETKIKIQVDAKVKGKKVYSIKFDS